jgi:hypothetical protein
MEQQTVTLDETLKTELANYESFEIIVDDQQSFEIATDEIMAIGNARKKLEELFRPNIKRAHELHKSLTSQLAQFDKPLEAKQLKLKGANNKYLTDQETKRREAQRIADEAAAKLEAEAQAKRDAEAKKLADEAAALAAAGKTEEAALKSEEAESVQAEPIMVVPQTVESAVEKTTRFDSGTVSGKKDIEVEVTDLKELLKAIINGEIPETVIEVQTAKLKAWAKMYKVSTGKGLTVREVVVGAYRGRA